MAGVTAARALAREGLHVRVLEARHRLGGRIHTLRDFCDAPVEAGAELIHGEAAQTWPEVRAAGLTVRSSPHAMTAMMVDVGAGARWLPIALLHPQTWPSFGVLHRLARTETRDMSAREFIERRGYRGRARTLAEMALTSHLPGSIDEIGIHGLLADGVLELETGRDHRVNEGYDRIVEYVARELDVDSAASYRQSNGQRTGSSFASVTDASGLHARPSPRSRPVFCNREQFASSRSFHRASATRCARWSWARCSKSSCVSRNRFGRRGWRWSAACVGPVTLYWNVFYGSRIRTPVLTAYCTGPRAAALARLSEDELLLTIIDDLRRHFPKSRPKLAAWRRLDWSRDPFACGGYTFLRPGGAQARALLAARDTGALFWAGSETATQPIAATVAGAYVSGLRAGSEVIATLEG